jgi:tetratricopeptide (TPR) repeat protein
MDASMISRLESGSHTPDTSDIARLAVALRLSDPDHHALQLAFERQILKSRTARSDILVDSVAALRLASRQLDVIRSVRAGGRPTEAVQLAEHLADWIQLLVQSALDEGFRQSLTDQLAAVLVEQYYGYLEYQSIAANGEQGSSELPAGMVQVAAKLADLGLWHALDLDAATPSSTRAPLYPFRLGLDGIRLRRQGSLNESAARLIKALDGGHLSGAAADLITLHCAHTMRNLGRFDDAEALYRKLAKHDGPYTKRAAFQLADLAFVGGRFQEALGALSATQDDVHLHGESLRLVGHIYKMNALLDQAEDVYYECFHLGRWSSSQAMQGKALANIVQTLSWRRPIDAWEWSRKAIAVNQTVGNGIELVKIHGALAVAASGDDDAQQCIRTATELGRRIGYEGGLLFTLIAKAFRLLLTGEPTVPHTLRRQVEESIERVNAHFYWLDILDIWEDRLTEPRASWLGGPAAAKRRWQQVLETRR